jgi:hypothetical protein
LAAAGLLSAAEPSWSKRADLPADLAGRELPPGMNGAWCYVPELKGFFLYGGYSPRINNEGWVYDPVKNTMRLLWPDDSLGYEATTQRWRVLMPRDIHWSQDRPGPGRGQAAVYSPDSRKVYLFGGHPGDRSWWGSTKLGTWELDPATLKFKPLGAGGPQGVVRAVYDRENRVVVAVVAGPYKPAKTSVWLFSPGAGTWEEKTSPEAPALGPCPGFAYDAKSKRCIYYSAYGETWAYDAAANQWANRKPVTSPPPRRHAGMCFDENLGLAILHGGVRHERGAHKDDPWTVYGSDQAFQFKREGYGTQFTDTWAYDFVGNQWRELKPAVAPPLSASERDLMAFDSVHGACVLYDPAVGFWALGGTYNEGTADQPPALLIEDRVLAAQQPRAAAPSLNTRSRGLAGEIPHPCRRFLVRSGVAQTRPGLLEYRLRSVQPLSAHHRRSPAEFHDLRGLFVLQSCRIAGHGFGAVVPASPQSSVGACHRRIQAEATVQRLRAGLLLRLQASDRVDGWGCGIDALRGDARHANL